MRKNSRKILSVILSIAIIFSCLSFSMITAFANEINAETGAGSSTVQYTVDPGWTATIPAYILASDSGDESGFNNTVTIQNVLLGDMQKLVATIDYDGVLSEENGIQLNYSLYDGDGKIDPGKKFAEIPAGDPDEVTEYTFGAALDEKPKYAGTYLGTVKFNLFVEKDEKVYTIEEIEANEHMHGIGKTKPEYVIAEFNEDFTSVNIFSNGALSDGLMMDWNPYGLYPAMENEEFEKLSPFGINALTLSSITFEEGVRSIGEYMFFYNFALYGSTLELPDSLISIGEGAFAFCDFGGDLILPESLEYIGAFAFKFGEQTFDNVFIPASVTFIGDNPFACGSDSNGRVPKITVDSQNALFISTDAELFTNDMTRIINYFGADNYSGTSNVEYTIPKTIERIDSYVFNRKRLDISSLPESLKSIGVWSFEVNNIPSDLILPNGLLELGVSTSSYPDMWCGETFGGCNIESVTIGDNLTTIADGAFMYLPFITRFTVSNKNENFVTDDGVLYSKDTTTLVRYPVGREEESFAIPDGVTTISKGAFEANKLTEITIPYGVTSIGEAAFGESHNLTEIIIPNSVTSIGRYAFYYSNKLAKITIPESVNSIGYRAFDGCRGLKSVTILNKNIEIKANMFDYNYLSNCTFYGYTGSTAEAFAQANGYTFIAL